MNCYNIRLAYDPKVIGVKNGIYQVELIERMYEKYTLSKFKAYFFAIELLSGNQLPNLDVEFYFKKLKSAKETSFLSFCPHLNHCHFLINENVQGIFKDFNIQPYKLFKTKLYDTSTLNSVDRYKMFFSVLQDWDVINFENTIFTSKGYGNVPLTEHKFANNIELSGFNRITKVKILSLTKKFDNTLDFFLHPFGRKFCFRKIKNCY